MAESAEAAARLTAAVGKLIAVTGDKSIDASWELGDAIVAANDGNPVITHQTAWDIRQTAIRNAGHEEFWSVKRLRDIGDIAAAFPKSRRLPGVSVTAHGEALAASDPDALLHSIANRQNGKVSVRDVRDALGANGGTKGKKSPATLTKASDGDFVTEMHKRRSDIAKYLRTNLKRQGSEVAAWLEVFTDLTVLGGAIATETAAPAASAPTTKPARKAKQRIGNL